MHTTFLGSSIRPNPCASLMENAVSIHDVIESGTLRRNSVFPLYLQEHIYIIARHGEVFSILHLMYYNVQIINKIRTDLSPKSNASDSDKRDYIAAF